MSTQKRQKLSQDIADYFAEKIICLEIAPGERITEARILKEWDASSSPAREALYILERYHLVDLVPRRGARVKEMSAQDVRCLFEVMTDLMCLIFRLCCQNATEEDLARLTELGKTVRKHILEKDLLAYNEAGLEFALLMLKTTRNPLLAQTVFEWLPGLRRAYFLSLSHDDFNLRGSEIFLKKIMESVSRRDEKKGEETVRFYAGQEKERIIKIVQAHFKEEMA